MRACSLELQVVRWIAPGAKVADPNRRGRDAAPRYLSPRGCGLGWPLLRSASPLHRPWRRGCQAARARREVRRAGVVAAGGLGAAGPGEGLQRWHGCGHRHVLERDGGQRAGTSGARARRAGGARRAAGGRWRRTGPALHPSLRNMHPACKPLHTSAPTVRQLLRSLRCSTHGSSWPTAVTRATPRAARCGSRSRSRG